MPETSPRPTLRVATYNLRGLKDDAAAAAQVVRAIDPDVLLLQEVPRYPASSYAIAAFARESGMLWSGRTRLVSGTSMMTSLRVLADDSVDRRLKVGLRENPRSYTVARVSSPGGPTVTAVSVHLSLRSDQRVEHAGTILRELAADEAGQGPVVLGGDLNEDRSGAARGALTSTLVEVSDDRPSFPAADPRHRIDAIFSRGHQAAVPGDPTLLEGLPLATATDHLPVWVDLTY